MAARTMAAAGELLAEQRPDAVVVQGDTTSAMVAALAAFYQQMPVVHLEAGLRTGDMDAPFPEEGNRRLVAPSRSCTSHRRRCPVPTCWRRASPLSPSP